MTINPAIMKKYHVESIEITREMIHPDPPLDWKPYEAIVVRVTGEGRIYKHPVDMKLCTMANPKESVKFAVLDTMQIFRGYIEHLKKSA